MKPYAPPPLWMILGFLTGWVYAKPGILNVVVWATANYAMLVWITHDVGHSPAENDP